jgi:ankyrin repeat protein
VPLPPSGRSPLLKVPRKLKFACVVLAKNKMPLRSVAQWRLKHEGFNKKPTEKKVCSSHPRLACASSALPPERKETEDRQKSKVKSKKAQAEQSRRDAEDAARALAERGQSIRSATFAAARRGDAERVKRAIWEDAVDANGGELRVGAEAFVKRKPRDPQETLLHISAKQGNAELVKWLDMHSTSVITLILIFYSRQITGADLEERNSDGFTAFHIALQAGHVPIVEHFLESYPPKDSEHDAIYKAPPSHSLLSLAMSSVQPECVWKVLDNGFATLQDVSAAQIRISSAERLKTSGQKADAVKHEDIRRLLDSFGASTPATAGTERVERPQRHHSTSAAVPSIDDQGQRRDSRKMAPRNGNRRTGQQSPSAPPETPSQKMSNTSAGRGSRGRGRGRGGGRGRGKS